jgi:ATP-binding cassette subfamily C protein
VRESAAVVLEGIAKSLQLLTPRERIAWLGLVPLAALTALVEALAAALVFGLIAALDGNQAALERLGAMLRWAPGIRDGAVSAAFVAAMIVFAARSVFLAAAVYVRHRVVNGSSKALAQRLLDAYLAAPYPFHLLRGSASLVHRISESADGVTRRFLPSAVALATELLVVAGLVALLVGVAPLATVTIAAAAALLVGGLVKRSARLFGRWGREQALAKEGIVSVLQQGFGGIKEVKVAGKERFFSTAFAERLRPAGWLQFIETTVSDSVRVGVETAAVLGLLLIGLVMSRDAATARSALPMLGLYAYAAFRIVPSANRVLLHASLIRFARAAVDDVHADWRAVGGARLAPEAPPVEPFRDAVRFDGVSFAYPDGPPVIRGVDFVIRRGEALGLVGSTGAGKTTLADLLLGLLKPSEGRITVDGRDVHDSLRAWQRQIGYVPQHPFLLDDTLRANIAFGVPSGDVDEGRLTAAVQAAQLESLVAGLPHGVATPVGERGARLSGGERQRVAIARALYRSPELLVLDEATAALDNLTERALMRALQALRGKVTLVVIAHRTTTMQWCDRLLFLSGGAIEASGSFDELATRHDGFRAITSPRP